MGLYYFTMLLTVGANLIYHLTQKSISPNSNPLVSILITYIVAISITLIAIIFFPPKTGLVSEIKSLNWASYALGFGIVAIELGFLFVYRAGWNISIVSLYSNIAAAIFLVPIGLLFFKESLKISNVFGIVLAIISIILLSK